MTNLKSKLEIASLTDAGIKRSHNEDRIASAPSLGLTILADGMGGYKAGEVASAMAINTIMTEMESAIPNFSYGKIDQETGFTLASLTIQNIIKKTNEVIYKASQSQPQYNGMGTTLAMTFFYNNRLTIAHVGDSRVYRVRDDKLEQITVDHTLLQELIERGFYTPEEAKKSMNKNLVTRALGIDPDVMIDIQEDIALPGDIYLLCSDGLNDMVEDKDIYLTIRKYSDNLDKAVESLVEQANENGGRDNISVILVKILKPFSNSKNWVEKVVDWFF